MKRTNYLVKILSVSISVVLLTQLTSCNKDKEIEIKVPENAIVLSSEGTANCYIVTPGTTSTIDARYKGNSQTELVGNIASASIVWQDKPSLVTDIYYVPTTGNIVFTTGNSKGNALIAAKDENNRILWSWHLWIVDYDPSKSLYTTPENASGTTWQFMDRNLGAISTAKEGFDSHGLIYQWGRKDPFTAAQTYTIINEDYSYQVDGEAILFDGTNLELPATRMTKEYHGTIEKSIANPTVYYAMTYVATGEVDEYGQEVYINDYRTKDWVDVSNDDYWGGVSGKKTIYDPCPVGYKVPTCDADGNTPYAWLKYAEMTWDTENFGANQNGQWFPAAGTRVYASGGLDFPDKNPYGGMWIGTAGKASSNPEMYPELYGQYMFIINGRRTFKVSKDARSQGMSLRCVKE